MKTCKKCRVSVPACRERCPLCQGILAGDSIEEMTKEEAKKESEIFPYIPTVYRQHNFLFRVLIFASAVVGVTAFVLNLLIFDDGWWSILVLAGIGAVWVTVAMAVRKRSSFCKRILYQVVTLSIVLVLFDWITGWHLWAVNYVVPGLCILAMLAIAIIAMVMHRRIENYIVYLVVTMIFGVFPLLFLLTGWADVTWPSVLSVALSVLSFTGMILFAGKDARVELKKRLHL